MTGIPTVPLTSHLSRVLLSESPPRCLLSGTVGIPVIHGREDVNTNAPEPHEAPSPALRGNPITRAVGESQWDQSPSWSCLLYTSDAADDLLCVDLGGRRIIKKKKK